MPAWVVIISTSIAVEWAGKIRQTPGTGRMVLNVVKVWMCEVLFVLIYPPFFYIFTTLTKFTQMAFALLLPIIKIFMRNVFMPAVVHLRDDLPEVVVFNVEVFNALFVSYCMQNSPSFWTTVELMLADIVLLALSICDIEIARRGLEDLERRIGVRNTKSQTTLERVETILQRVELSSQKSERGPTLTKIGPESATTVKKSLVVTRVDALSTFAMAPHPLRAAKQLIGKGTVNPVVPQIAVSTKEAFKPSVGLSYTRKVRRLLFMTEFVLLLNYVEVAIPLVFCKSVHVIFRVISDLLVCFLAAMYMSVMYYLPNRAYYAQLADLDEAQLLQTLQNVLFYCSLQLLSLLILAFALQRKLGLSPIRQLSFVLEKQFTGAQIKLIFWVFYNVQASLKHSGYDYTFQFNWLREHHITEKHRTSA
ncbi:hypothetical protein V7S43_005807 [Phytophthora oleae]|uniref:Transmembrane protein n=1 Tax=Phytophthora oleae TaxID=2107226 RepID=A0ABD3FRP4_9STRA